VSTPNQPMSQLWPLTVDTPAGVTPENPQITPWPLVDANLEYIDIIIPDGPSGQLGVAVYWSGTQIVPWGTDSWLITNDEKIHIPVDSYITVSGLAVYTYNQGIFGHTIYLRALVKYTTTPVVTQQGTIGASIQEAPEGAEYDESLTPAGLDGNLDESGEPELDSSENPVSGDLTALPESII
jgi:hypothetical protein